MDPPLDGDGDPNSRAFQLGFRRYSFCAKNTEGYSSAVVVGSGVGAHSIVRSGPVLSFAQWIIFVVAMSYSDEFWIPICHMLSENYILI